MSNKKQKINNIKYTQEYKRIKNLKITKKKKKNVK